MGRSITGPWARVTVVLSAARVSFPLRAAAHTSFGHQMQRHNWPCKLDPIICTASLASFSGINRSEKNADEKVRARGGHTLPGGSMSNVCKRTNSDQEGKKTSPEKPHNAVSCESSDFLRERSTIPRRTTTRATRAAPWHHTSVYNVILGGDRAAK